jgi:hypothetical protein
MSGDKSSSADNQQETMYYFSGFFSGEGSISIIRATNKNGGSGFYYTPDMTISNADSILLKQINQTIFCNKGVMTPIKGGYNLSLRGKNKVIIFLDFLKKYPPLAGDLIREKLALIKKAVAILLKKGNRNKRFSGEIESIEHIRQRLRVIKKTAQAKVNLSVMRSNRAQKGFFLSGVVDAEGSMGFRKCGKRMQPYFSVAMKDKAIIDLLYAFVGIGNIYYRPPTKLFHFETAKRENIRKLCHMFLYEFPVQLSKNRKRLESIYRILNDYTRDPRQKVG